MNPILESYFQRLNERAKNKLEYFVYERRDSIPYSVNVFFESKNGSKHNAWGSGESLDEALGKGLMELIERLTFSYVSPFKFKKLYSFFPSSRTLFELSSKYEVPTRFIHPANTNGVAIHLSKSKAKKSALYELIERHTILTAFLFKVSPHGRIKKTIAGKECEFFYWKSPLNTFTHVGCINLPGGQYYSSGCDFEFDQSLLKAQLELNSFLFLESDVESKKIFEEKDWKIFKDDIDSINRYHRRSGDFSAYNFLTQTSNKMIPDLAKNRFYYSNLPQPEMFKGLFNFPCVRVIHPDAQQLFFDNWSYDYINPRLGSVELPDFPHIIA